jgi:hypothetical protein
MGCIVMLTAMAALAAPAGTYLLGIDFTNNNLVSINPNTGVFSVVGTISGGDSPGGFLGIANDSSGNVYAIDTDNSDLYKVSKTGAILNEYDINSNGAGAAGAGGFSEGDMTFIGSTGYVDNSGATVNGLFSFTAAAGSLSGPIGGVNSPTFDGLAYSGSTLYGLSAQGGTQLYTINPTTGAAVALPNATGISLGAGYTLGGLAYGDGVLYAEVSGDTHFPVTVDAAWLYTINTTTGVATLVGEIEDAGGTAFDGGLSGIAFETPEPGTIGLMFLGLAGMAAGRRRWFKR